MRKAILRVALSSLLALSLGSANNLESILQQTQDSKVTSLLQYQSDPLLHFRDHYGFTLYDYALTQKERDLLAWLAAEQIQSGVESKLVQQTQVWLYLLKYPVDNLEGKITPAFQNDIAYYQEKQSLPLINAITPEWFIPLERKALQPLIDSLKKENPNIAEAELLTLLNQRIEERLPSSAKLLQTPFVTATMLKNIEAGTISFQLPKGKVAETGATTTLPLSFLTKAEKLNNTPPFPGRKLQLFFDFNNDEIETLLKQRGSRSKIFTLQTWLRMAGYFPLPLTIDGQRGANTRTAIERYQASLGQKQDGIPNPTWEAPLEKEVRKDVQRQLILLGFYDGEIDGINGIGTENAIKAFEKSINLPEVGTLSPNMLFHLFNAHFLPESILKAAEAEQKQIVQEQKLLKPLAKEVENPHQDASATTINQQPEESTPSKRSNETDLSTSSLESPLPSLIPPLLQVALEKLAESDVATESKEQEEITTERSIEAEDRPTTTLDHQSQNNSNESSDAKDTDELDEAEEPTIDEVRSLITLDEPLRNFSLSRSEIDNLVIKARVPKIFFTQTALSLLDLYDGPLDGANGPATREAIRAFEKALGQNETGELLPRWENPLRQIAYRFVQYRLKEDGFYKGDIDGLRGPGTREAIKAYEKSTNTEAVGALTPVLLLTLFNDDLSDKPLSDEEVPSDSVEDVSEDGTAPITAEEDQELQADSNKMEEQYKASIKAFDLSHPKSSEETALEQLQLAYLGFYTGTIDGLKGPGTNRAVEAFQKSFSLPVTGKLDQKSRALLEEENINKFQRYLQRTGYMKDRTTGTLGPKTRRAIGILKNRYGYQVSDKLDLPAYLILIDEEQETQFAKSYYEKVVKEREAAEKIVDTQAYLIGFGILNGRADGKMGPATEGAIQTYRSQQGLKKGKEIDTALLESFKKNAPKQAQTYLQQLGYPIKPDGIFGKNSKKQLNAFLTKAKKPQSEIVTAEILMELQRAVAAKVARERTASSSSNTRSSAPRPTAAVPPLKKGLQQDAAFARAPGGTVNGRLQIVKNGSGQVVGCKVNNITMAADWCTGKRNGAQCRVLYKNQRVLSMSCK